MSASLLDSVSPQRQIHLNKLKLQKQAVYALMYSTLAEGHTMPNKNIYMDQSMIDWIDKKRKTEDRSFSNFVVQIIRREMERKAKR